MLNFKKRIFLFLTILVTVFCLASCADASNTVRINFDSNEYVVRMQDYLEVEPKIEHSASISLEDIEVVYESSDESVVSYQNGVLYPQSEGEATIKVYWKDKEVVFDKATVKVIKPALPTLQYKTVDVIKGDRIHLSYELHKNYTDAVATFTALNPEIAEIDEEGYVTAHEVGVAKFSVVISDYEETSEELVIEVNVIKADYKITYELNGGVNAETNPSGYNALELPLPIAPATKEGYVFDGWLLDDQKVDAIPEKYLGDVTLVATWKLEEYAINYELNGGVNAESNPTVYTVESDTIVLADATRENYTFKGWTLNGEVVTEIATGSTGDVTLVANWEVNEFNISLDPNGGHANITADTSAAEVLDEFVLTYYLKYNVNGLAACINDNVKFGVWWSFIALRQVANTNVYEIVQTGAGSKNITEEFDLVIGWHDALTDADLKAKLNNILSKSSTYVGQYVVLENVPEAATTEGNVTVKVVKASTVKFEGLLPEKYTPEMEVVLPEVVKEGYTFLGWFNGDVRVEKIEVGTAGDVALVAKWEITHYTITADADGGKLNITADTSAAEVLDEFVLTYYLKYNVNGLAACINDNVKFGRWWSFIALRQVANTNVYEIVQTGAGSNKITEEFDLVIGWHDALTDADLKAKLNNILSKSSTYVGQYVVLENVPEAATTEGNITVKVVKASTVTFEGLLPETYTIEDEVVLPTLTKEGHTFLGWFNGDVRVEKIAAGSTGNVTLVAKWEVIPVKHAVEFELNGGTCEGLPTEYVEGTALTLPTPTKDGFTFVGWFDNAEFSGEAVTEISATSTGDVKFFAKWEEILTGETYNITYDLNEGNWQSTAITSYEGMAVAFVTAYAKHYGISELTPADFMEVSYNHGNLDDFFDANADWAWVRAFVTKYCQDTGNSFASNIADKNAEYHNTILRANVHGFINQSSWPKWPASADYSTVTFDSFKDNLPAGELLVGPATYVDNQGTELVEPVREGYTFLGWFNGDVRVEKIEAGTTGDIALVAKWRVGEGNELVVGAGQTYETLEAALAVAVPGDVIKLLAGTYEGATITVANVTIEGPNAGISAVDGTRVEEAIFTSDITIATDGVTVDGICLTGVARLIGSTAGTADTTITNVLMKECTLNQSPQQSTNAPLYFFTKEEGAKFLNLTITNCANVDTKEARSMIMYGADIENLTLENNKFVGVRSNYNDGMKLGSDGSKFGLKGDIRIVGNHFENYSQYVIWLRSYSEGTYTVENNTFVNCGQTATSHATINFITYAGAANGVVTIDYRYNTVRNSYATVRIDANDTRNSENLIVKVNYNKVYDCNATYVVNNKNSFDVDATNNYYDKAVSANLFNHAVFEPYYTDESQVPVYGQPLDFYAINYELDGGAFDGLVTTSFDSKTGLDKLPVPTKVDRIFVGWLMDGELVTAIPAGTNHAVTLTAKWREDAIYVSKNGEDYAVATLAEAIALAKAGDKIIVLAGEYEEDITISVPNLTLAGVNEGLDPHTDARSEEAVLKGVISVTSDATNLVIDGLSFTGNAKVKSNNNSNSLNGFTFQNNIVHDIEKTTNWILNRYVSNGFIEFSQSGNAIKNFEFFNNKFTNVGNINILVGRIENLTVDGNSFVDFGSDAIRVEGGYNYGLVAFTNNNFEQTIAGHGNNAIFTYAISGAKGTTAKVLVQGNEFKQIGSSDASTAPYNGTISSHFFQENTTSWTITDNVFDHCLNNMWIRNNGANVAPWSCNVENNKFLGVPSEYYFGTYQGSDTETTNPHLAVFGANYYEDNEGNVITDLTPYADKFKHLSTYGTAVESLTLNKGEKVEFYAISYDLAGGSAKGLVTSYNKETGVITLPTPTWNIYHEFAGWTLNGEIVTEIPADSKGDLHLVATWNEIIGNPATLEFELNGGNWNYGSFDDISIDLLNDYNAWGGTNYTQETLKATMGAWSGINVADFYYSDGMSEKWAWLAAWLGQVGGNANKAACTTLTKQESAAAFKAVNSNYAYAVTYEFRAFMVGSTDYTNGNYKSSDYSDSELRDQIWAVYAPQIKSTIDTTEGKVVTLPTPKKPFLQFGGWYNNPELTGEAITEVTVASENPKLYAKWFDANPVTGVVINNAVTSAKRFSSMDLDWTVSPAEATNKEVKITTSDSSIATVTSTGHVEFLVSGTVTIKVTSAADSRVFAEMTVNVFVPEHIEGKFESTSHVVVNDAIELTAELKEGTGTIVWTSNNPDVATVENGIVTGVKAGTATIVASKEGDSSVSLEFVVVVVDEIEEGVVEFVASSNNANVFLRSQLGIGAGGYAYYADVLSSTSKLLFEDYVVDKKYYAETPTRNNHSGVREGKLEFITVHYTGNMAAGSTAGANANYFVNQSSDSSIHYVTGNDGIFACYDEKYVTWHAGDGTGTKFEWYATGVTVNTDDPELPVVTITSNSKFAINGRETTIACPQGYERVWDSAQGKMVNGDWIVPTDNKYLTPLGPAVKVVDGEYYIGETWWCNSQVAEGRICSRGGNLNSIGIESACNEGSDLWYTWQRTAQLVADLLIRHDLDITRVKGHNFYSAKDCPQPLLENDLEIWWEFIELVKAEKAAMTTYKDWTFTCVSNNPEIVSNNGRVISQPEFDTCVTYTVTCTNGTETKTITMSSMVPGIYHNLAKGER